MLYGNNTAVVILSVDACLVIAAYQKELYCDAEGVLYKSLGMIRTLAGGSSKLNIPYLM